MGNLPAAALRVLGEALVTVWASDIERLARLLKVAQPGARDEGRDES